MNCQYGAKIACIGIALLGYASCRSSVSAAPSATSDTAEIHDALPDQLSEKAEAAAEQYKKAIAGEMEALGSHEWAGGYYCGDGLGVNISLLIAPESGFLYEWRGCMGLYDRNYGAVAASSNGLVQLIPVFDPPAGGLKKLATDFLPVPWGDRLYLVETNEILHFCGAVNSGSEPRPGMRGSFLLRKGDEAKPAEGLPSLPEAYRHYLHDAPLSATLIAVGERVDKEKSGQRVLVTIDAGRTNGFYPDMQLYVMTPTQTTFNTLTLTQVDETQSQGILMFLTTNAPLPECGWTVSTWPPWREPNTKP